MIVKPAIRLETARVLKQSFITTDAVQIRLAVSLHRNKQRDQNNGVTLMDRHTLKKLVGLPETGTSFLLAIEHSYLVYLALF